VSFFIVSKDINGDALSHSNVTSTEKMALKTFSPIFLCTLFSLAQSSLIHKMQLFNKYPIFERGLLEVQASLIVHDLLLIYDTILPFIFSFSTTETSILAC